MISIHAPRTGSDEAFDAYKQQVETISIHAPRTGSDHVPAAMPPVKGICIHPPPPGGARHRPEGGGEGLVF